MKPSPSPSPPPEAFDRELEERLVRYARIDTQSDEKSTTSPSTQKQYDLLKLLVGELKSIGAQDVQLTDYGVALATIPATAKGKDLPTIALLAHVDTAPAYTGTNVKPIVHRKYDGSDIVLPDIPGDGAGSTTILSPKHFPYLATKIGEDIITASGATLLGADDKAGVAIVMTVARHLLQHPQIPHGRIRIAFTPDEEIGRGVHKNLPGDLKAEVAYTLDGAELGEVVYETFSADKAVVHIEGVSIHPGQAKDKLVNALHLAAKIIDTLPHTTRTPETTAGRDGFIHIYQMSGTAAAADLHFILRDFELDQLREHGELLKQVCAAIQATEPRAKITCTITQQYRNMRYWLENDMRPVELARQACRAVQVGGRGIEPIGTPIRGGTDGSRLTEQGVPTPNLFTGMQNIHGPHEWISVQDMSRAAAMCIELAKLWSKTPSAAASPEKADQRKAATDAAQLVDWAG
ncbi:MAG: peptidase T [Phycisphaerales bacterium]|nr:peptidase T [Phycisphaerales bacterium]MCI0630250.1 peptidase T [Phycisphaerales bacterium]